MSSEAKEQEKIETREARGLAKKQGILAAHNARPTLQKSLLEINQAQWPSLRDKAAIPAGNPKS